MKNGTILKTVTLIMTTVFHKCPSINVFCQFMKEKKLSSIVCICD